MEFEPKINEVVCTTVYIDNKHGAKNLNVSYGYIAQGIKCGEVQIETYRVTSGPEGANVRIAVDALLQALEEEFVSKFGESNENDGPREVQGIIEGF